MAKVSASTSGQPASRQSAEPTPDVASKGRKTRGEPQQSQRRSARNTRGASVESEMSPAKATNAATTDLTTLAEDVPEDAPEVAPEEGNANNIVVSMDGLEGNTDNGPSPSRASAVSGFTAKTTFSMEEVNELDTDLMLDGLKDLERTSGELFNTIISAASHGNGDEQLFAILDDLATPGTKSYKLCKRRFDAFESQKKDYVTARQDYIRPQNVSRALFGVSSVHDIPEGVRRPDSVLYKANLANMLHTLLVRLRNPELANYDQSEVLDGLNQAFPTIVSGEHFSRSAFDFSIALTAQLAIKRMETSIEDPNFSAQGLAEHAFFSDAEDGSNNMAYRYHNSLHLDELSPKDFAGCMERITGIVNALKGPHDESSGLDPVQAVEKIRATSPWSNFITSKVVPYCKGRLTELDNELEKASGIDQLDEHVKLAAQNKDDLQEYLAQAARLESSRQSGRPRKRKSASAAAELKALHASATPSGRAPVAQMTAPPAAHDTGAPSTAAPNAEGGLAGILQLQSFNDRQEGAHRVAWDDSQVGSQQGGAPLTQSSVLGKRAREAEDEHWDPTQDGGPQQDDEDEGFETRPIDNAAAEARRNAAPTSMQTARPYFSQPPNFQQEYPSPTAQRSPKRRNPGSIIPGAAEYPGSAYPTQQPSFSPNPNNTPASTARAQEYEQAAWTARQYRILNNSTPARERRPWTSEETEALMTYIAEWPEEDPLRYATIKRKDDTDEGLRALGGRTAEDIRFRVRNMKVNFLLGRSQDMHENWGKVQLGKKEIDKLHSRGVPYNQVGLRGQQVQVGDFEERNE